MLETCSRLGMDRAGRPAPRLCRRPEQGTRTDRTAGVLGGRRSRLLEYLSIAGARPGLCPVVKAERRRERKAGATVQAGYCISSLETPVQRQLVATRGCRRTGNPLRWSLDVTFREGRSLARKDHGPRNMAALRQISRNLLKRETSLKAGIQGKRLQAGWREDCLPKLLPG